jgi:hypothetical protein
MVSIPPGRRSGAGLEETAMATIKASCPCCGEVELTSTDVRLVVCSHPPLSFYAFTCPTCADEVRKPADDHIVALLVSGGVEPTVLEIPSEALEDKVGPPLGYDELLDFVLHLGATDLLAERAITHVPR